jgi:SAM-dependent methyltransferase
VDKTDFPDSFFDLVLSNEALSHYRDIDGFLHEASRLLKPGGILLIADGNNGANRHIVRHTRAIWDRFENGPAGEIDGHYVKQPYVEMRAEMIRRAYPDLGEEIVRELAWRTSGMVRDQILHHVARYLQHGEMPTAFYRGDRCPVNPESGIVLERLLHPAELARHIETFGFRARYYAYFGGAGGNLLVRWVNSIGQVLSPITLPWARAFRIVAVRQG